MVLADLHVAAAACMAAANEDEGGDEKEGESTVQSASLRRTSAVLWAETFTIRLAPASASAPVSEAGEEEEEEEEEEVGSETMISS